MTPQILSALPERSTDLQEPYGDPHKPRLLKDVPPTSHPESRSDPAVGSKAAPSGNLAQVGSDPTAVVMEITGRSGCPGDLTLCFGPGF